MRLKVLGSGSSGNTYILENETEALIIEAGIPFKEVKKALDFNVRKIVGVICSHRHKDHFQHVKEYLKVGIPVVMPEDCLNEDILKYSSLMVQHPMFCRDLGGFHINAFDLVHDVECLGFHIQHSDIGNLIYASDTEYIKCCFKGLNHILVEANHSKELVDRDSAKYTHQITGHMEIETTCKFLEANNNPRLRNVVLLHLSGDSADADDFKAKAEKVVDCPVWVAGKGLEVDLNLCPF